ncbi:MAG: hypothetical protein PWQ82_236 [Thermosediminibacterales bacterium]|nr:hypothetical protein [Thermosediminibacterales bacterium]MDK2835258.1 hypothetical protein [Thermosediminibacterales bacterium]
MKAKDIMTKPVISVTPETTIEEVSQILFDNRINGVPVVNENNEVIGIVTGRIIIRSYLPSYLELLEENFHLLNLNSFLSKSEISKKTPVKQIMLKPYVVNENMNVVEIAAIMTTRGLRQVIVVNDKNQLTGIISKIDIVRAVATRDKKL